MKHSAQRSCAHRDGPQAEAPATPADEGRPTTERRRVRASVARFGKQIAGARRHQMRHVIVTAGRDPQGARGRGSDLEHGRGRRTAMPCAAKARTETHPCTRPASAAACARACGPAAAVLHDRASVQTRATQTRDPWRQRSGARVRTADPAFDQASPPSREAPHLSRHGRRWEAARACSPNAAIALRSPAPVIHRARAR